MALKTFRPTSPGLRHLVIVDRSKLWKGESGQVADRGQTKKGGRNNDGRITSRHRGGGAQAGVPSDRLQASRQDADVPATVERIEYDPNRTAFIALVKYSDDGRLSLHPGAATSERWRQVVADEQVDVKPGNAMPLAACRSARSSITSS
jgi:large subunit ribosomal protein L2